MKITHNSDELNVVKEQYILSMNANVSSEINGLLLIQLLECYFISADPKICDETESCKQKTGARLLNYRC